MQKPKNTPPLLDQEITAALHSQTKILTVACLPTSALRSLVKGLTPEETATDQMAHVAFCALCRDNYVLMQRSYNMAQQASHTAISSSATTADTSRMASGNTRVGSDIRVHSTFWNRDLRLSLLTGSAFGVLVAGSLFVGYMYSVVVPQRAQLSQMRQQIQNNEIQILQQRKDTDAQRQNVQEVRQENKRLQSKYATLQHDNKRLFAEKERLRHQPAQVQIAYDPTKYLKTKRQHGPQIPKDASILTMRSGDPQSALIELTPTRPIKSKLHYLPAIFEVKPLPGAAWYQFKISGTDFHNLIQSPKLSKPVWKLNHPNTDMPRGVPLEWQVIAYDRNNKQVGMYTINFQLSDQQSFAFFLNTKLALGITYAEGGDVEAARREFQSVLALNARNTQAKELLSKLPPAP